MANQGLVTEWRQGHNEKPHQWDLAGHIQLRRVRCYEENVQPVTNIKPRLIGQADRCRKRAPSRARANN